MAALKTETSKLANISLPGNKIRHFPFLDFLLEARNVLNLLIVQHATCSNTRF